MSPSRLDARPETGRKTPNCIRETSWEPKASESALYTSPRQGCHIFSSGGGHTIKVALGRGSEVRIELVEEGDRLPANLRRGHERLRQAGIHEREAAELVNQACPDREGLAVIQLL
jgi:hypothetical protein